MAFASPMDAKKFLAGKIAAEAAIQGMPLSDDEKRLLLFSEQDPESPLDIPLEMLEGVNEEYEKRITSLLRAAYERDGEHAHEQEGYRDAIRELQKGDHYLSVMAEPVLSPLTKGSAGPRQATSFPDIVLYVGIGLALVAAVIAFVLWKG